MGNRSLAEKQEEMKQAWERRRAIERQKRAQASDRIAARAKAAKRRQLVRERKERIRAMIRGQDLRCPACHETRTKASPYTGIVEMCRTCQGLKLRLKKYELSLRDYFAILKDQETSCAICNSEFQKKPGCALAEVDRSAELYHVRGLLCGTCMKIVKMLRGKNLAAQVLFLEKFAKYLRRNDVRRLWSIQKDA